MERTTVFIKIPVIARVSSSVRVTGFSFRSVQREQGSILRQSIVIGQKTSRAQVSQPIKYRETFSLCNQTIHFIRDSI
jgi:hypothetical protein